MKRIIDEKLIEWAKHQNRKPLILQGARQVGKTFAVKTLGQAYFNNNIAVLDLEKKPEFRKIFNLDLDPKRILEEIQIALQTKIMPGKTLLFIDEIQTTPKAIMSLRYFYEEMPLLHVIAAGSLLEFAMQSISFPVGRVQFLEMYPMNFYEFLLARANEPLIEYFLKSTEKFFETAHNSLKEELKKYFFVGGMPEAVKTYCLTQSLQETFAIHQNLIHSIREDFSKYTPHVSEECLNMVLSSTAQKVGQQLIYTHLTEGFSSITIKKAFYLLCKAQIIQKIPSTLPEGLPLGASASAKTFKAIMLDIGLMQSLCGLRADQEYLQSNLINIYRGALAEQFVGQELRFTQENQLYYWTRRAKSSTAEVDYVITKNSKIYPVEVKSGSAGHLKSVHIFLEKYINSPHGYVFRDSIPQEISEYKLKIFPLYQVFLVT